MPSDVTGQTLCTGDRVVEHIKYYMTGHVQAFTTEHEAIVIFDDGIARVCNGDTLRRL